jgi:hypothetical protein
MAKKGKLLISSSFTKGAEDPRSKMIYTQPDLWKKKEASPFSKTCLNDEKS